MSISLQGSSFQVIKTGCQCLLNQQGNLSDTEREIDLRAIDGSLTPGYEIEIKIEIGLIKYHGFVYEATLKNEFLLGLDFMKATLCELLKSESCI